MDGLHRNTPAVVILSFTSNKVLKVTDYQKCQQRLLQIGLHIALHPEPACAVEDSEQVDPVSLISYRGSTYEVTVPNEDGLRYFLYGMHVDDTYYFLDLDHGPYIFHKIEQTDLAWILENVGENERKSSLPSEALRSRYNKVRSRASGGRP